MKLLETVEKLMHIPTLAAYPILTLIEKLESLMEIKQNDNDIILNYLERVKLEIIL